MLIYDPGCSCVGAAREALSEAFRMAEAPALWTEWCVDDSRCPRQLLFYGSPTILVNGADVAPGPHRWSPWKPGDPPRCRSYEAAGERTGRRGGSERPERRARPAMEGVPPLALVAAAIRSVVGPQAG